MTSKGDHIQTVENNVRNIENDLLEESKKDYVEKKE